jgi:hypothetical protein
MTPYGFVNGTETWRLMGLLVILRHDALLFVRVTSHISIEWYQHFAVNFCPYINSTSLPSYKAACSRRLRTIFKFYLTRFGTLTAKQLKIQVFFDVKACRLLNTYGRFETKVIFETFRNCRVTRAIFPGYSNVKHFVSKIRLFMYFY